MSALSRTMLAFALLSVGCSDDGLGQKAQPLEEDPSRFPLTLREAEDLIAAHDGVGCLRLFPYVECRGCDPRYRLETIAEGAVVGPCEKSTFVAGTTIKIHDAAPGKTRSWTCASAPLGGTWFDAELAERGALVCR